MINLIEIICKNIPNIMCILCTIIGLILVGEKKRSAFIVFSVANFTIIYIAINLKPLAWGLIITSLIYFGFNIKNYMKWKKDD